MAAAVMGHICRVRSEFLCPGSPVDLNHGAKVETVIFNDCDHVRAEMLARIDLQVRQLRAHGFFTACPCS